MLNEICKYKTRTDSGFPKAFKTFTTCYHDAAAHDETYYARQVNQAWGTDEHLIYPDEQDTLSQYRKMVWHMEDYVPISTLGSFMTLGKVAESGVKVIINGQGGDESMLGYERYYAYYLKDVFKKNPLKSIKLLNYMVRNSKMTYRQILQFIAYFDFPMLRINHNIWRCKALLNKEFLDHFDKESVIPVIKSDNLDALVFNEIRKTQLTHILRMDDRAYMAFSMESRVPFIDYKYLEEAVKISPLNKMKDGYTKYLLREKMKGSIPNEVIWRKNKNGWSSPGERWLGRFDRPGMDDMLSNPRTEAFFNMDYVCQKWQENPMDKGMQAFLFTEVFMREFNIVEQY